jgi:flagellar protein FliO/FliZ
LPAVVDLFQPLFCVCVAVTCAAVPAAAQGAAGMLPTGASFGAAAVRSFGALAVVLACVVALSYAARRLLQRTSAGVGGRQAIEIVASRSLGGRSALTLVEVNGERLLVGSTPQSLNLICKVGAVDTTGDRPEFDELLRTRIAQGVGR